VKGYRDKFGDYGKFINSKQGAVNRNMMGVTSSVWILTDSKLLAA
jgi:hypothetical protein